MPKKPLLYISKLIKKLTSLRESYGQGTVVVIVVSVLIVLNYIISPLNFRLDLSKNKAYSLSDSSKRIVKNLKSNIKIKAYISSNLPIRLQTVEKDALDLLGEYVQTNPGKLNMQKIDPEKDAKIAAEAEKYGVPQLQFNQLGQNNFQSSKGYFGLVLEMGEKREVLPTLTNPDTLEYDLSSLIYKLSGGSLDKVGILGGAGGINPYEAASDPYQPIRQILAQQFDVSQLPLATSSASIGLSDKKVAILIADEGTNFDENTSAQLEKYTMEGGNLIVLADGVSISGQTAVKNNSGLEKLLNLAGMKLAGNLIAATTAEFIEFKSGDQMMIAQYPLWFRSIDFEKKNTLFSGVDSLFFPWGSSIEIDATSSAKPKVLVQSPTSAWAVLEPFDITPENQKMVEEKNMRQFPLIGEGNIGKGRILLIPTAKFANAQFLQKATGNLAFLLNAVNNYASSGLLSGIRARSSNITPLKPVSPKAQESFKYLLILSAPLVLILWGSIKLYKRSKKLRA